MARNTLQSRESGSGSCRWLIGLALVLIVFLGTTSCSKKDDSTNNETASPETTETASASPSQSGEPTTTPASGGEPNTNQPTGAIRPMIPLPSNPKPIRPKISLQPGKPAPKFEGTWRNVDRNTKSITRLVINKDGDQLNVRVFYKCKQKECDYGAERGQVTGDQCPVTFDRGSQGKIRITLKLQGALLEARVDMFSSDGKPFLDFEQFFKKQ